MLNKMKATKHIDIDNLHIYKITPLRQRFTNVSYGNDTFLQNVVDFA